MLTDIVNRNDVRMIEAHDRLDFAVETLELGARGPAAGAEHLQGDAALHLDVLGQVDDAHAARPDLVQHPVGTDVLTAATRRRVQGVAKRGSDAMHVIEIDKEGLQGGGQVGMPGNPVSSIRAIADGLSLQEVCHHLVEACISGKVGNAVHSPSIS